MKFAFFGDSYTQGTPYPTNYEKIWPNIVAKHFDAEADNQYVPGGSNQAIFRKICNYIKHNKCDLIIVMWSHYMRNEIHLEEKVYQIQPFSTSFSSKFVNKYYKNQNTEVHWNDFLNQIWLVEKIVDVPNLQGCCFPLEKQFIKPKFWFEDSMWSLSQKNTPCGHPHISEHKKIALQFIKHINDNNLIAK